VNIVEIGTKVNGCGGCYIIPDKCANAMRVSKQEQRHLEVRVGNVETESGGRQVFGSVVRAGTDIKVLINRDLDAVGRTGETELTAFTDGCSGLRNILATRVSPRRHFSTGFTSE
jgi:hypothetical protein